ncbi:ISAzo13 family transposase [Azospirillum cavernae]|uniref:ISAzo13 family transposase n=1 Tax=Azospirillum cavernae TaxID=2320860 RepID=A0A418W3R3_9PROT|nr:ISAzo13 family transposase [Azospirillum cavernae]RJF84584.1 ISAzo13 family transposase [Azospirillum cavernae]
MIDEAEIRRHYQLLRPDLDERGRRLFAATQVRALGHGGLAAVARATGIARSTIGRGLKELDAGTARDQRVRRPGGGRKRLSDTDATLAQDLLRLVEPATLGDPIRPLLWVSKSVAKLAAALRDLGHRVSANTVRRLLRTLGFSRQGNFKANEGRSHPDRDGQFEHINAQVLAFQAAEQPVISVDTKKKELIGNFKNPGTDWRAKGRPRRVNGHDFADKTLGKAIPYGVYDVTDNSGWVSVGITHDTAQFAVNAIRLWLEKMGRARYPSAKRLLITADCGGSNGARVRLWKRELQALADETGLSIQVSHYPPGTSKWNKIEHRLFCQISQTWRARPLTSRLAVVELIAATTTKTGLTVACELDTTDYPKGLKVSDAEMDAIALTGDDFHPEWNYTISPRQPKGAVVLA